MTRRPDSIVVDYKGETVTYYESENRWNWNGSVYLSLSLAKDAINKSQKSVFKRTVALYVGSWSSALSRLHEVDVTSKVEGKSCFWVSWKQGKSNALKREQAQAHRLFLNTDANRERAAAWQALEKQKENLTAKQEQLYDEMEHLDPSTIEPDDDTGEDEHLADI